MCVRKRFLTGSTGFTGLLNPLPLGRPKLYGLAKDAKPQRRSLILGFKTKTRFSLSVLAS
jgi:hypothetical protein